MVLRSLRSAPAQNIPATELRRMTHLAVVLWSEIACMNSSTSYLLRALRLFERFILNMTTPSSPFSTMKCGAEVSPALKLKRWKEEVRGPALAARRKAGWASLNRDYCCLRHDEIILYLFIFLIY